MDITKTFWDRYEYPAFPHIKERRLHELLWLLPQLKDTKSLLDIGCGDGALVNCLSHLTDINLYACDFSEKLMRGVNRKVSAFTFDCRNPKTPLPHTDVAILAGVIQYLIEDTQVDTLLASIPAHTLFLRSTCDETDNHVNTVSEALGARYESRYRTKESVLDLIKKHYPRVEMTRIYPDEIESNFGTKQWYFTAHRD